ncbi:PHD finger protein MS1/MMD1 [Marchantia polymorpha subsp. ruderalis]|uniref:Zinc finger PHD-type domain-containing protein n=2 Tax=Marchantia polymorpha TaxID=3197 RepID=A0AAF6AY37_MARPO|nr:hypothetical protein MARPO_0006s0138 [Marchantia polymorpha]BBN04671.1 hypothetical protein Mp_3g06700 [Marchantia polymorpha subsp. ruderalis]|eukprot:PTQ48108.1 hypothetical protein MARPO_0006s0138 [Marchantia polymorpha]
MVQYRPHKRARVQEQHSVATLGQPGCPADFEGPFRSNIRSFLHDFARGPVGTAPALCLPGVRAWTLPLRSASGAPISLYILEETPSLSPALHCDRCRVLGWAHHPVCRKRYHFIIGSVELEDSAGVGKGRKLCLGCSCVIPASTKTCPGCGSDATKSKVLEARTHLLHGLIHANGYGHLLRVNGREGGSHSLSGREIMDLWDRLCSMLRARKVSVMDVSKKYNLEFRLLHGMAHGHCWYGRWGYAFGRGSFNISPAQYAAALRAIESAPLKKFTDCEHADREKKLSQIVAMYRHLSKPSPAAMTTLGHLVRFMMDLLSKLRQEAVSRQAKPAALAPAPAPALSESGAKANANANAGHGACRWPAKRLEQAQDALLSILRASETGTWLSRQTLRENARSHIGDTGLLDFVLKGFVDKTVKREIVRRRVNARTRMLEYRLESVEGRADDEREREHAAVGAQQKLQSDDVVRHLALVYEAVQARMADEAQILLDVKQLMKDYEGEFTRDGDGDGGRGQGLGHRCQSPTTRRGQADEEQQPWRVLCHLAGGDRAPSDEKNTRAPPPELVVLPWHATIGDLKQCAEKAFRDVYLSFEKFQLVSIAELPKLPPDDGQKLSSVAGLGLGSGSAQPPQLLRLHIEGTGIDETSAARHEAGTEDWVVNCCCGTQDDDGERMAECCSCQIWHHTRCLGILDSHPVPQRFVCHRCRRPPSSG